jgi:uncharacterized protein
VEVANLLRDARRAAGLTQEELAERAGTSQPAVARYEQARATPTLSTLERLLLVCGRRPVIQTIEAVETPNIRRLRHCRRALLEAARQRGVRRVRVFGSVARGIQEPGDIDLLVDLAPGRTLLDLAGFRREAIQILGTPVDVATLDMLKERIRPEVLAEAVPL